ncbi:hypothetical protein XA68_16459 [Ophiocordyceps unilateralis]|uniref:Uncharacterized protein n=1 Tax=Ophiocordyceps unilateralis TaxID=268505 RepID=A0A2A9PK48_OPHUN|nr:hypothetical protein XA68_16459 [Ophiocordyceps unilateralis]
MPPEHLCVFKEQALGWVQVMEHNNFCTALDYLQHDGRMIGARDVRILATNESADILLRIPEAHFPQGHFEMYYAAKALVEPDTAASLLQNPTTSCAHEGNSGQPAICKDCLSELQHRRLLLLDEQANGDGGQDDEKWLQQECNRHLRHECQLCNPPIGYGRHAEEL